MWLWISLSIDFKFRRCNLVLSGNISKKVFIGVHVYSEWGPVFGNGVCNIDIKKKNILNGNKVNFDFEELY